MTREPASREKWRAWLAKLRDEVLALYLYRKFWRDMMAAAKAANVPPSHIFNFLANAYAARQAVAIRRIAAGRPTQYSFRHLLTEIRDHPRLCANAPDLADVVADIKKLDSGNLGRVREYVDEFVAHKQVVPVAEIPTFKDVSDAIDDLGALLQKYFIVVLNEEQMLEPIAGLGDVMAPFRMAWLPARPARQRPGNQDPT
jgi:AbiU2